MQTNSKSTNPLHIAVSKSRGLTIDWADGHKSEFSNQYLRDKCPCASCVEAHEAGAQSAKSASAPAPAAAPFQMFKPKLRMNSIEEVGTYAVRIYWNDAHNAGIYSYDYLRAICPCADCAATRR